jgi:hypothetical protein
MVVFAICFASDLPQIEGHISAIARLKPWLLNGPSMTPDISSLEIPREIKRNRNKWMDHLAERCCHDE